MTPEEAQAVGAAWQARGVPAFPIAISWNESKSKCDKRPLTEHGHSDATLDPEVLAEQIAAKRPRRDEVLGIGLRPGAGGFVIFDGDVIHDRQAADGPGYLLTELRLPPYSYTTSTGSGGVHRWYRKRDELVEVPNVPTWEPHGIEVRADRGWVVAPGTVTPWGTWERAEGSPDWPTVAMIPERAWIDLVGPLPGAYAAPGSTSTSSKAWQRYQPAEHDEQLHPGTLEVLRWLCSPDREHPVDSSLAAFRLRDGGDPYLDLVRPGKNAGTSATLGFIGPGVLKVWSSNWPGLASGVWDLDKLDPLVEVAVEPVTGQVVNPGRYFDKADGLKVATLAADVAGLVGPFATGPGDTLWPWRDGVYVHDDDATVRAAVVGLLGERHRGSHLTNTVQVLKARHTSTVLPAGHDHPDGRYLNLTNGLLDWQAGTLLAHDPAVPSVHRIPLVWDPAATCPATDGFLASLFGDEDGVAEFILEVIAAAIYGGHPFHQRAVMLLGRGKNGKGSFIALLRAVLGSRNVSEVKPQALDANRFASARLYGKLANIAGDVSPTAFVSAERFKEVVAGDVIDAEHKYGQPFSFHPVATILAAFNEMPSTADRSDGFFRRWLVVPFPHRFVDADGDLGKNDRIRDPHIAAAITTPAELSGLLVKVVEALRRLYDRGDFAPPAFVLKASDSFREHGDPVVAFLRDTYRHDPDGFVSRAEIGAAYRAYCEGNGLKIPANSKLYAHVVAAGEAALGYPISERKRNGLRGFLGIEALGTAFRGSWGTYEVPEVPSPLRTGERVTKVPQLPRPSNEARCPVEDCDNTATTGTLKPDGAGWWRVCDDHAERSA